MLSSDLHSAISTKPVLVWGEFYWQEAAPGKQDSIVLADSKAKMCLWAVGSAKVCVVAFLEPLQRNAAGFCAPGPYNAHLTLS